MEEFEPSNQKSILEAVSEMAEFANAVASMVVGHRRILVEGLFNVDLADQMAAALHAQVLGLVQHFEEEGGSVFTFRVEGDEEEEEEE